ncbi:MAG TPA: AAA family ATPase [Sphingomonas sp.]
MTDLRKIAAAMGGEVNGNVASFPTPGHGKRDRGSWASLVPGAPDGVLINSANGGDPLAIKDELRAKGVLPAFEPVGRSRDAAAWEYQDADGVTLYRKVRMSLPDGGKSYRFEHPDGRGGWAPKRGDVAPVPYRLPDLARADRHAVIYMAEGEKKADKLASWGLVATSSKDWRGFDFSGYVKDRTVIILPDNDTAGVEIAEAARKAVERAGGKPVLVELPGLPPKGDIMDWSGDAAELARLVEAAMNPPAETFELADLSLWANTAPTPKAFVMPGFIPRDDVVIVTGDGGTNKSTLALQISACAAAGRPFLGMDLAPGPALYITAEDDQRENHWRLAKIASAIGTTLHALAGRLHVVSLRGRLNNELATFDHDGKLRTAPAYALLRATIEQTGAKLVTLDNVAHLFPGNENDRGQVTAFINLLYQLCGDLGVTILLIAHRNKNGDSYSGSTAWLNAVRSQVLLERMEGDPDARQMTLGKANYARAGEALSFRWHDFALVRDSDLPADKLAEVNAVIADNAACDAFLACLRERDKQGEGRGVGPATGPNYAPVQFETMPHAKGLKRIALKRAMDALFQCGVIETFDHKVPGKGRSVTLIRETGRPPNAPPERVPNTVPERPRTVLPNTPPHTPYTTYKGGAFGGPRPLEEPNLSRPIFAAEPSDFDDPFEGADA